MTQQYCFSTLLTYEVYMEIGMEDPT